MRDRCPSSTCWRKDKEQSQEQSAKGLLLRFKICEEQPLKKDFKTKVEVEKSLDSG
jgi:hypothetical protein